MLNDLLSYLERADHKVIDRQKEQDRDLAASREERTLLTFGVLACLKGLKEQGCNGPVTEAIGKIEGHINRAAHNQKQGGTER